MTFASAVFAHWRDTLLTMNAWFTDLRTRTRAFSLKAFGVFFVINMGCFWWALLTARADLLFHKPFEYALMSVPVAAFGAMFDIASLRVTLWAIRQALKARNNLTYVAFLGVDLAIAAVATFWVLFVFVLSGWLVSFVLPVSETLAQRADLYQGRIWHAVHSPLAKESLKNIYFGMLMGASALIPTILHASFAAWSLLRWAREALAWRPST